MENLVMALGYWQIKERDAERMLQEMEHDGAPYPEIQKAYDEYEQIKTARACIEMCARMAAGD